jgi:hypothetical protein
LEYMSNESNFYEACVRYPNFDLLSIDGICAYSTVFNKALIL